MNFLPSLSRGRLQSLSRLSRGRLAASKLAGGLSARVRSQPLAVSAASLLGGALVPSLVFGLRSRREARAPLTARIASAVVAVAAAAVAVGAMSVGVLAISRLAVKSMRISRLRIDQLDVRSSTGLTPEQIVTGGAVATSPG